MSTKANAGNRLPASMFSGLSILASILLLTTEGHAQARFPREVVGHWCGVHDAYDRFDVNETEYEEGDGLCRLVKSRTTQGAKVAGFDLDLHCETGAEGKKPFAATHKFTAFEIDNAKYMMRAGSIYVPKALALYKQCKE
jgi:hypothetical protein